MQIITTLVIDYCMNSSPLRNLPVRVQGLRWLKLSMSIVLAELLLWWLLHEHLAEIIPHDLWGLCSVDAMPEPLLFVVIDDGGGLRVEDCKALRERLHVVIRTLDKRFSGDVVRH